ncbi:MAG: GAF domain-containing protein, partial [Victivallales bacterium]|nr:GAF domain-containing protein [Victivallales bacterium]
MRLSKYQVIHRISELIVQAPDPWSGLQQATELLAECTGADVCGLLSYNPTTGRNSLVAACGILGEQVGKLTLDSERGLVGLCAKTGRTFNVDDRNACTGESMPPLPQGQYLHGMLAHPLIVSGSNIGCLILIRKRKHRFPAKVLEMLDEISGSLGMFILNATLYGVPLGGQEGFSFQRTNRNRTKRIQRDKPIKGRSVTTGVVSGEVVKIASVDELLSGSSMQPRTNKTAEAIKAERETFFTALESARRRALRTVRELQGSLSEADCKIFEMHVMLLDDPSLRTAILKHLDEGHNLASALSSALHYFTLQYQKVADPVLRARLYDIKDIFLNIKTAADNMRTSGRTSPGMPARKPKSIIVVAKELLPSQLVSLPLQKVRGILCEDGGTADHVAIVARALQKSMVVGIPGISDMVRPGDSILLDANSGNCYLRPSLHLMREFATALKITRERQMLNWKDERPARPSVVLTKDNVPIHFTGNLALLNEMPAIHHFGLEAIGLYRTEFMFMIRNSLPTEEEQFQVLKRLLGLSQGLPVTVRVLDAGGDKSLPYLFEAPEDNPSLGLRGLRFLFSRPDIFLPHLRAILRASAYGKLSILFPMV